VFKAWHLKLYLAKSLGAFLSPHFSKNISLKDLKWYNLTKIYSELREKEMSAYTQEKFILPRNLRGRSIHLNVIPTVSNLKNMLDKLVLIDGDVNQLKQWEKRSYTAYQINKIKLEVMNAQTKEDRVRLIKQHILNGVLMNLVLAALIFTWLPM
jgi:hypothetical protein